MRYVGPVAAIVGILVMGLGLVYQTMLLYQEQGRSTWLQGQVDGFRREAIQLREQNRDLSQRLLAVEEENWKMYVLGRRVGNPVSDQELSTAAEAVYTYRLAEIQRLLTAGDRDQAKDFLQVALTDKLWTFCQSTLTTTALQLPRTIVELISELNKDGLIPEVSVVQGQPRMICGR